MSGTKLFRVNRHMPGGGQVYDGWIGRSEWSSRSDLRVIPTLSGPLYCEDAAGRRFALSNDDQKPWWLEDAGEGR